MKHTIHIAFIFIVFLSSCFKKEDAITLPIGVSNIATVPMGKDYKKEVYFDLGTNTYQEKTLADWDLRFESGDNDFGVFLNNGTNVIVYKLNIHTLDEPSTVDTLKIISNKELVDPPEGKALTSAIGDWRTYKSLGIEKRSGIYAIKLPYNSGYDHYKRLQIIDVNDSVYFVTITELYKNSNPVTSGDTIQIPKDKNRNYTYYSFRSGGIGAIVPNPEPLKGSWDFVFTRYKYWFYGILPGNEPFPYIVTGVISNPNRVEIARDSTTGFDNISFSKLPDYTFSDVADAMGYDWKWHAPSATGTYRVNSKITYIIKDTDGDYFKLRFLDFLNAKGENGYPKFEYVQIK